VEYVGSAAQAVTAEPPGRTDSNGLRRLNQGEVDAVAQLHARFYAGLPGGKRADFGFCDLSGLSLAGCDLCDANFSGARLTGANLVGLRAENAVFFCCDMRASDLRKANLRRSDLRGASLRSADLAGADLFEADLREGTIAERDADGNLQFRRHGSDQNSSDAGEACFASANLERANLSGMLAVRTDFSGPQMKNCKLIRANLKQADFSGANLEGSDLSGADMTETDLTSAVLTGVNLSMATLHQTTLANTITDDPVGTPMVDLVPSARTQLEAHVKFIETDGLEGAPANLSGVDIRPLACMAHLNLAAIRARKTTFYGLDLRGVKFQGAQLEGADFRAANLESADLRGANLSGANFSGAILRDCNMRPLIIDAARRLPTQLVEANLQRSDLRGAYLAQAVLDRANVTGARL
jgi:uncharacterized protein YjbI with pentapeptide repeats